MDATQMVHESHGLISLVTKLYQMELLVIVNVKEEKEKWRKNAVKEGLKLVIMHVAMKHQIWSIITMQEGVCYHYMIQNLDDIKLIVFYFETNQGINDIKFVSS